jgi:hypothetical protein
MIILDRRRLFMKKTLLLGTFATAMIANTAVSANRLSRRDQRSRLRDHQAIGI